jgi:hypothetical protein
MSRVVFAQGDSLGLVIDVEDNSGAAREWIFTATIGNDWGGFPFSQKITMGLDGSGTFPLDHTGTIYLTAEYKTDDTQDPYYEYGAPVLLRETDWFLNTNFATNAIFLSGTGLHCCYYNPCPLIDGYPSPETTNCGEPPCLGNCDPYACCSSGSLGMCGTRAIFENPPFNGGPAVNSLGQIHLVDAHGGSGSDAWGLLKNTTQYQGILTTFWVYFHWVRPGQYAEGAMTPGVWQLAHEKIRNRILRTKLLCVHHSSSDFPGTSRGVVDASDLAVIVTNLGRLTCYGVYADPPGCTRQTWYCDLNQSGGVDASDLSSFAADLYSIYTKYCTLSKMQPEDDPAAILN